MMAALVVVEATRTAVNGDANHVELVISRLRSTMEELVECDDNLRVKTAMMGFSSISSITMYRTAASRLRALKGRAVNRSLTRSASSSAVVTKSSSGGLFSWLTGESSSSLPPLQVPLKGVTLPPPLPDHVEPGKTKITTLPNGVKIASETSPTPSASIGLYVDCGSIYETPHSFGATHLLERMAFKSTTNRSYLRVVREVEAIGGNVSASASREQMGYTYDALKTYVPEMVELLIDCVRNPVFLDWEVNEQLLKVKAEIAEASNNPQGLLLEAIHSAGYSGALGNPLLTSESAISRLDSTILEEFVAFQENYTAARMVLAASGVEHEELMKIAEPLLSDLPSIPRPQEPKSVYVGGDYRCQSDPGKTHFALAFEAPGGWKKEKEAMTLTVLQMLMGGGGSFSAGGPGKGMYSRLYLRVLNEYPQIQSFSAFNSMYNNTGIFGIQATTGSDFVPKAIDIAVKELIAVATPGEVDQVQLDRAKQSTRSAILMNLESRMVASEDIGRQILTYGESMHLCAMISYCVCICMFMESNGVFRSVQRKLMQGLAPMKHGHAKMEAVAVSDTGTRRGHGDTPGTPFDLEPIDLHPVHFDDPVHFNSELSLSPSASHLQSSLSLAFSLSPSLAIAIAIAIASVSLSLADRDRAIAGLLSLADRDRKPVEHFLRAVDEVSLKDIASIAQKLISTPLTMASYGDVIFVPSYDSVSSKFCSK
ncbi:hypothetical protein HYC85_015885 [Camellia sinensis]|uniref:Mitochondrial-processing peptidase subunit alpha n=1 Tax=Camellia sinensis TaxID=4442 RepID=A0A7J7GZ66_CAMSI|nr:hypothetical protein HYC85_015885 [Camellia sinensis]